jgi:hypothetical protein
MRKKRILELAACCILLFAALLLPRVPAEAVSDSASNIFDISEGYITVSATGSAIQVNYGASLSKEVAAGEEITITGITNANRVIVSGVTANITLASVDIRLSGGDASAFELVNGANVTLTLEDGTSNVLKGVGFGTGLRVPAGQIIMIQGTGTLSAIGGSNFPSGGCGIGGKSWDPAGTISISGGTVIATGGLGGAGIGGGDGGIGGIINISGGTVIATGGDGGAGIGGGNGCTGGTISISGGTVTATGNHAAGIGGGCNAAGGTITISATAIVKVASNNNGTKPAIDAASGHLESGSTAYILSVTETAIQSSGTNIGIYQTTPYSLCTSFTPTMNYYSFAVSVPTAGTYYLKLGDGLQKNASGVGYVISTTGITSFSSAAADDASKVAVDKAALTDSVIKGSNADLSHVTGALAALPTTGMMNGSTITWSSSLPSVLSSDGQIVVRPAYGLGNEVVTLTASISKGAVTESKIFTIIVLADTVDPDLVKVAADKAALIDSVIQGSNADLTHVTGALAALPTTGSVFGSTITWSSSLPSVLSSDGQTVVRPAYGAGNAVVTLTASISKGAVTDSKIFTITVLADTIDPDLAKVAADRAALTDSVIKGSNADLSHVTGALAALPTTGLVFESTITWSSSLPSVLSSDGQTVGRPAYGAGNASVTLTASISKGAVTDTKGFTITVLADTVAPAAAFIPVTTTAEETVSTSKVTLSQDAEHNHLITIQFTAKQLNSDGAIMIPIPIDIIKGLIAEEKGNDIIISLVLPEEKENKEGNETEYHFNLAAEIQQLINESKKALIVRVVDGTGNELYQWTFDERTKSNENKAEDVMISLQVVKLADYEKLNEALNQEKINGFMISFDQNSNLSTQAGVKIYVGNETEGFAPGHKIYVYHYNRQTGKLETLPYSSGYTIDENGYLTLKVIDASDYIVLSSPAPSTLVTSLRKQIRVSMRKGVISFDLAEKSNVIITLPVTLERVEDLQEDTNPSGAIGALTITYSSNNEKVAVIDDHGIVKAVGKGKALITVKIKLYSGKTIVVKKKIRVL